MNAKDEKAELHTIFFRDGDKNQSFAKRKKNGRNGMKRRTSHNPIPSQLI